MRKILVALSFCCLSLSVNAQSCEEKEPKLVQGMTSFSAALLYNTYGVIGSISDAYVNDIYSPKMVNDLLAAQKKLLDNLTGLLGKMTEEKILDKSADIDYARSTVTILMGLKKQADLMMDYVKSKTPQRLEAYEAQRNKNWEDISKLMGIPG